MAYVVVRRCRIGDWREPGEVLSAADLHRRNVRHMEFGSRVIRFDPSVPEPEPAAPAADEGDGQEKAPARKPARGRAKAAADEGDGAAGESEPEE